MKLVLPCTYLSLTLALINIYYPNISLSLSRSLPPLSLSSPLSHSLSLLHCSARQRKESSLPPPWANGEHSWGYLYPSPNCEPGGWAAIELCDESSINCSLGAAQQCDKGNWEYNTRMKICCVRDIEHVRPSAPWIFSIQARCDVLSEAEQTEKNHIKYTKISPFF